MTISPNKLNKYLRQIFIEIEAPYSKELLNIFISEINKTNINEILQKHEIDSITENKEYIFRDLLKYIIYKEKVSDFSINISSIDAGVAKICKNKTKSLIENIKHINTIIVSKTYIGSYVIACMYSLSQIKEFAEYFFVNNVSFVNFPDLLLYFQEFINKLWKNNEKKEKYKPEHFEFFLKEKYGSKQSFKEEREPIEFLDLILKYLNSELNNKDEDIKNDLIHYQKNIKDSDFLNFYIDNFVKMNNSIVYKIFYGVFKETSFCEQCGESSNYTIFNYIDLNITNYSNYQSELDNSLVYYYLEDLIEFYFNDEKRDSQCEKCFIKNKITKKIIKFPEVIIFRINWKRFSKDNGFQ